MRKLYKPVIAISIAGTRFTQLIDIIYLYFASRTVGMHTLYANKETNQYKHSDAETLAISHYYKYVANSRYFIDIVCNMARYDFLEFYIISQIFSFIDGINKQVKICRQAILFAHK